MEIKLDKNLFFPKLKENNQEELLKFLGNNLYENGYVQEDYTSSLIDREKEYPTGLPSTTYSIAIPHTNHTLVNETTISVATLNESVPFHNMADSDELLDVKIVIMLAISDPDGQLEMLQKVSEIIQNEEVKESLIATKDKNELLQIIKNELGGK